MNKAEWTDTVMVEQRDPKVETSFGLPDMRNKLQQIVARFPSRS